MEDGIHLISHFAGTDVFCESWDTWIFDGYSVPAVETVNLFMWKIESQRNLVGDANRYLEVAVLLTYLSKDSRSCHKGMGLQWDLNVLLWGCWMANLLKLAVVHDRRHKDCFSAFPLWGVFSASHTCRRWWAGRVVNDSEVDSPKSTHQWWRQNLNPGFLQLWFSFFYLYIKK